MLIEINNITKRYVMGDNEVMALREVNLCIERGEYISIMGPSGSGKSTFMNILGCLDTPSTGEYKFNGVDVSNLNDDELSDMRNREIGFVFQNFNLLPRVSAVEQVELPDLYLGRLTRFARRRRALELLRRVGLAARGSHTPAELSGGQQQRVAIARALMNEPPVLFADEPTGNLDSKNGKEVMDLLTQLNKEGTTVVMVTHSQHDAGYATRTINLFDGQVVNTVRM